MQGTVLRAQSGFFWVQTDAGLLECRLRGRLKKERQSSDIAVIGDLVEIKQVSPTTGAIEAVEPRRTKLARRAAGTKGIWSEDVLIANLDQVLLVFACASPDFHPRMLDRYLALTESSELETVIVANKLDLVGLERACELFESAAALSGRRSPLQRIRCWALAELAEAAIALGDHARASGALRAAADDFERYRDTRGLRYAGELRARLRAVGE